MNTSVKPILHMLDGIKVGTHCWLFHLLNVQISQDSSGDAPYMSPGIVVHEYEFRAHTICSNQCMLQQYLLYVPHSSKITMDDDKICMAINTDVTPHHHRTLSESVTFLDNIWYVLLTTASPNTLSFFMLCQGKSGVDCEQQRFPLAKLPVDLAMSKQKASYTMLLR